MIRRAIVDIDLAALKHNFSCIQSALQGQKILAMIKADAYGHGMLQVARALTAADAFGVATVGEAVFLQQKLSLSQPVVVMAGFQDLAELKLCEEYQLQCVIHCKEQLDILAAAKLKNPLRIWLKIDTGMHRLGFYLSDAVDVYELLLKKKYIQSPIGLMTHLACAGEEKDSMSEKQLQLFESIASKYNAPCSVGNSVCILRYPTFLKDWIRPGLMLYGVQPFSIDRSLALQPVMTFKAPIMAIKQLVEGDAVGYGATWTSDKNRKIAIVGAGYGDGYPQQAPSGTPVVVNGQRALTVGRVSMDMLVIDVTNVNGVVRIGDMVELWGKELPIDELADQLGMLSYELLCRAKTGEK